MRLAKECKVAIIEKTYDGGVCLPERSANMSLRGKLVVFWMKHRPRHIATTQMVALMFAAIILLGALLLTLPAASRDGVSCGLRPALFTATSATCVTGLVLYDTWSQWSGFGQIVILCLIQIGGLGFMSVATLLIFLLRRKIGLQQRLMIAQSLSVNDIKGVVRLQKLVLTGSFSVEAVGAIILTLRFWPEYGFTRALRWEILHLRPVQRGPVRQELVAYPAQSRGIGGTGDVLNAHQIEAGIVGSLGGVNGVLAHGAPGRACAAKAVQRLHKGGGAAFAHRAPCLDVKIKVFVDAKAGQHGAALAAPCVGANAHPRALGPQPGKGVPHAGLQFHLFVQLGDHLAHHVQIAVPVQRQRIFPDEVLCACLLYTSPSPRD